MKMMSSFEKRNRVTEPKRHYGFTLIELLIVMAILTVLLALISIPLIQGMRLTQAGQAFASAQNRARLIVEKIRNELTIAAAVFDNAAPSASIEVQVPIRDANSKQFLGYGSVYLSGAKLDFIEPAKGDPGLVGANGALINPGRGKEDPTLKAPIGQIVLPLAPGTVITRYWIGLKDPLRDYLNPHEINVFGDALTAAANRTENLYVLYHAQVAPYVWDPAAGQYVPNTAFFAVDNQGRPIIDDPGFFLYNPRQPIDNLAAHRARLANWMRIATIVSHDIRDDMLVASIDESTREGIYDPYPYQANTEVLRVRSLVRFSPMKVTNESATGNKVLRSGVEITDYKTRHASEYFETEMIAWSQDSILRVFRGDFRIDPYFLTRYRQPSGGVNPFEIFEIETVVFNPTQDVDEFNDGDLVFEMTKYLNETLTGTGRIGPHVFPKPSTLGAMELVLYSVDYRRGLVKMSFPIKDALGYVPTVSTAVANNNLTGWQNSATGGASQDAKEKGRRFIDLRSLTGLQPDDFNPLGTSYKGWTLDAHIVPGSEIVIAPDQRPGPNYGNPIRYSRVAITQKPGINQYRINYVDLPEPNWTLLGLPDPSTNSDVATYILPQYKKGYIEFNSDQNAPLPDGNIVISVDFQMNKPEDSITVDYSTAQQMVVELTVRRYPGGGYTDAQAVTVREVVAVRNFIR
ncbi:MAG TPA: prepilin-type N-terminal cleavage/methylation domain-containing protein [Fimbriimonadales bacterium]|nr:prepilin-type N-terminal cleavage/methylation domain-containing protein [Fimbriimonadales bacterium]